MSVKDKKRFGKGLLAEITMFGTECKKRERKVDLWLQVFAHSM